MEHPLKMCLSFFWGLQGLLSRALISLGSDRAYNLLKEEVS